MLLSSCFGFAFAGTLDQAVEARRDGAYPGAILLLETLHTLGESDEEARWNLERGLLEELTWNPEVAEPYYRKAIEIGGDAAMEARYHLVVVLDDLNRFDEARMELRSRLTVTRLNAEFRPVLRIEQGVLDIHAGSVERGKRRIVKAVATVGDVKRHAWMVGRGRFARLNAMADRGERIVFEGCKSRVKRSLKARARVLKEVEAELFAIIETEEPEWITSSLLRVGDTYADLADDLISAPAPAQLSTDQVAIYRTEIGRKAAAPRTKAFSLYDHGVSFATRMSWESPVVDTLKLRRDALAVER